MAISLKRPRKVEVGNTLHHSLSSCWMWQTLQNMNEYGRRNPAMTGKAGDAVSILFSSNIPEVTARMKEEDSQTPVSHSSGCGMRSSGLGTSTNNL
ncbi:hypothetical protein PMN64_37625 [Bradyrhizobium sp. UFLA01-814]|uniref:hypothetical protein n=1 Tax=Bradyrhizobium sp. UFLA01-814 TaxID=3023480 RepID=UPI00398A73C9